MIPRLGSRVEYDTLIELLRQSSPSGQERPAVEYLVGRMQEMGFTRAFIDEAGNAVGMMGTGPKQIILLGHIDTVPGEIPIRIETAHNPQGIQVNLLYGRGSVDAKGPLAAFTEAAARLRAFPGWQIVVIGAVEEERDSEGARYIKDHYRPNFAIIGEPSGWERVTLGYKGSAWAEISLRVPQAHTAHQSQSASEIAFEVWGSIREWCAGFNQGRPKVFDQITPTLRRLASDEDSSEMWASLRVGVRLPLDFSPVAWYDQLEQILYAYKTHKGSVDRQGYTIPAYLGKKNTPLVRSLLTGIRAVGGQPGFVRKTGTADLNIVAPAWGCPAVAYGPGDSALDHCTDEHIDLGEYAKAVQVLSQALAGLMANGGNCSKSDSPRY